MACAGDGGRTLDRLGFRSSSLPELPDCLNCRGKADERLEEHNDGLDRETHVESLVGPRFKIGTMERTEYFGGCGLEEGEGVACAEGPCLVQCTVYWQCWSCSFPSITAYGLSFLLFRIGNKNE